MGGERTPLGGVQEEKGKQTEVMDIGSINMGKISFVLQPPYNGSSTVAVIIHTPENDLVDGGNLKSVP